MNANKAERDKDNPHCIHYDNQLIFVHGFNEEKTDATVGEIARTLNYFGDMLEALKEMRDALDMAADSEDWRVHVMGHAMKSLRAAIEKAEKR